MSPTTPRKKLIEVSIPLEAINKESAREKSIRHGHPSTLHLWWARRPLAACRAVLFAQLVDDPSACPKEFPTKAEQDAERHRLHKLIAALVPWEASNNETILKQARYEIARSVGRGRNDKLPLIGQMKPQQIIDYLQKSAPPVYDPFSGGGSIPLEAQRLGLKVMASDLNPVAVLIGKALIEVPPRFAGRKPVNPKVNELHQWIGAQRLADDVRYYGEWMRERADKTLGYLYPKVNLKDGKEATVIAWLWARTVPSPDPRAKGALVPLASSFLLSAKAGQEVIVTPVVDRANMTCTFEINDRPGKGDIEAAKNGTKAGRATFTCLLTGTPIGGEYINAEAQAGRMSEQLMAIVAQGPRGRVYLPPLATHTAAADAARKLVAEHGHELNLPVQECRGTFGSNARGRHYKFKTFVDYFTPRQLIALTTFSDLVREAREQVLADAKPHWSGAYADDFRQLADGGLGPDAYADAVMTYLGFVFSSMADRHSTLCTWDAGGPTWGTKLRNTFARQGLPMTWDYAEANPLSTQSGSLENSLDYTSKAVEAIYCDPTTCGQVFACASQDLKSSSVIFSTDPPYYDNISYADLSDYFYVWMRRTLAPIFPDLFRRVLVPKSEELVATNSRHGGRAKAKDFFFDGMKKTFVAIASTSTDAPTTIYYAYKQKESEGWATFLQALVDSGLAVDATWPIRSELSTRMVAKDASALDSSIVHVCRPRDQRALTITRADFLRALRRELPAALNEIRHAGIGPTDLQQAAIGPGIGILTRFAQVLNTDGTPMVVKDVLKLINQVREEITSADDADYDSATRFALDWFVAHGFNKGQSSRAIAMTDPIGLSLADLERTGFFEASGRDARLLNRDELPDNYDPDEDGSPTVWKACQHLIKRLRAEDGGIDAAAVLYNRLGSRAVPAHALARRLYDICEQNKWPAEGYAYNQLHQEWNAIEKRAVALAKAGQEQDLFSR
jgi:putative DNA methylase